MERVTEILSQLSTEDWMILFQDTINEWLAEKAATHFLSMGGSIAMVMLLICSVILLIYETANEKHYRRHKLKFIETDDISTLNYYLKENYPAETIGKLIINAYEKDKEIKRIIIESRQKRKDRWKKLWKRLKDKEQ